MQGRSSHASDGVGRSDVIPDCMAHSESGTSAPLLSWHTTARVRTPVPQVAEQTDQTAATYEYASQRIVIAHGSCDSVRIGTLSRTSTSIAG